MRLYFGGAEIGSHRSILEEQDIRNVSMSYMGLRRRVKFSRPWLIKDKFPDSMSLFLDSGAYTLNVADEERTEDEIEEIFEHYVDFVNANIDRVEMVSEFDVLTMGLEWIEEQRDSVWSQIPREKFMAVWHPVWGLPYLHEMASRFEIIGIPETTMSGRNLRPVLNALAVKGTRIHGIAMTKTEEMQSIRWDSVASTSWISPQRYGDTIVWTGNELKRYPKKYKDQARKRHRMLFKEHGFDAEALAADDPNEVLRLSAWSWKKFEESVNRRHRTGGGVTPLFSSGTPENEQTDEIVVDPQESEVDDKGPTVDNSKEVAVRREPTQLLPVMGLGRKNAEDEEEKPTLTIRSESARVCNTCFLSEKCPGYQPDSNCVYNIPITLRTREERKALQEGLMEMQTQRVMFMRFAEEMEGGYADPNLTKEIGLLNKMMDDYANMERDGFSLTISARGGPSQPAQAGMISRIFGSDTGQRVQQIEGGPVPADDVIDAEYTEEEE